MVLTNSIAAVLLVVGGEQPPFGPRVIKSEIDELPRELCFFGFYFGTRGGETKGTASCILFLIATHFCVTSDSGKD